MPSIIGEKQTTTLRYEIEGGFPAKGEIECLGAKNFATKAMVAALLANSPTELSNVPDIGDVALTAEMLGGIGVRISRSGREMVLDPQTLRSSEVPLSDSGTNRIPILLLGALLHKFDAVTVPVLGGCKIGARNVDFHVNAIRKFGGIVHTTTGGFVASKKRRLTGAKVELPYPSVGATETCLYLGVLAEGKTVISNAAIEPEIMQLITMMRAMGAIIYTSSGRDIRIEGVRELRGTRMHVLGDRIEAASWACLACASDGDIVVHGIRPDTLGNFLSYFQSTGGGIELIGPSSIRFFRRSILSPAVIETDVFPGFSTDWQQPFAVLLTQASGVSVIHETVYETRFGYLRALNKLGARTQLSNRCLGGASCRYQDTAYEHSTIILGPTHLEASGELSIPDLRAGLAYVIAAAIATGMTTLLGIEILERGYGNIVPRLRGLGLHIERSETAR